MRSVMGSPDATETQEQKPRQPKRPGLRQSRPEGTKPQVPDHKILQRIGTGAYGEVWLARSVTGAFRAVKVLWREDFKEEGLFAREFEGILNYEPISRDIPGLVHILHVGRHGGKYPHYYYVMELADDAYTGMHIDPEAYTPRSLESDMKQYGNRPMPLDYVLEAGCQLARALEGLHAENLTHRDVKPGNVIFVNGRVKLADAGLVGTSHERAFVGTEGYIPPEGPGTPRADVYALAMVLYEMATGLDRMRFPALPDELPEDNTYRRWLDFNRLICMAAAPTVSKKSITRARTFAIQLETLRDQPLNRRRKRPTGEERERKHLFLLWLLSGLGMLGLVLAAVGYFLLPEDLDDRLILAKQTLMTPIPEEPAPAAQAQPPPPAPEQPKTGIGQFFVGSVPSAASVYTEDGKYLDETPYGPITAPAGKRMGFILRKEGFADAHVSGIVPDDALLSLGGELRPYRPPQTGRPWTDAQGTVYNPAGGQHEAREPITPEQFELFMGSLNERERENIRYEIENDQLRTTQAGAGAFTLWLTRQCEEAGTIGRDHSLIARPVAGTENGADMCGYRLCTVLVQKTPISIYTNPGGASVLLNGMPLGITPMQNMDIPMAPYYLEIRLPGYFTERRSGLSPKDLVLNLSLKQNNSLIFGTEWINSLGMKFQPVSPSLMAGSTEVRVVDFRAYCQARNLPEPQLPDYPTNEHHPVVFVSRTDAEEFAWWLTQKERAAGIIEQTDAYRLPTDVEWSALAGCQQETGHSPYDRQRHHVTHTIRYPWGIKWPPPRSTGNFADMSALAHVRPEQSIPHYNDGFEYTAPVGSFAANAFGLHDLAGNVQEWVSDEYGGPQGFMFRQYGVTRGGDFNSFRPGQLSTHSRTPQPVHMKRATIGFRLVLERKQ